MQLRHKLPYEETGRDYSQTFSEFVDDWQWNYEKARPEVVGKINIQEKIQSASGCALQIVLDKYLPAEEREKYIHLLHEDLMKVPVDDENVYDCIQQLDDDRAQAMAYFELANHYREQYNMSPDSSLKEVFDRVKENSDYLKQHIDDFTKGGEKIEKSSSGTPEPAPVPAFSNEGAS